MSTKQIQSIQEFKKLRTQLSKQKEKIRIRICMTGCRALGALDVAEKLREGLQKHQMEKDVRVVETGCIGLCAKAPVMVIDPSGIFYGGVTPEDIDDIITRTLKKVTSLTA